MPLASLPPYLFVLPLPPSAHQIMTLPPWAYRQRQELSPIQIEGVVEAVRCRDRQCLVSIRVTSVRRNATEVAIHVGDRLQIHATEQPAPSVAPPGSARPAPIGLPQQGVSIPSIGQRTPAWLRPSPQRSGEFELMAGPYGFGPELAPDVHP